MDDTQLARLRQIEAELIVLRDAVRLIQARIYEVHEVVVDMITREFAQPLAG